MPRQFKTARKMCNLKLNEAAKILGVSQPTLSSWESGRKSPTIDSILKMADLYKVSTDYLLGNNIEKDNVKKSNEEIPHQNLRIMHGQPVWSSEYGWMLVDSINNCLVAPDEIRLPFEEIKKVFFKVYDALEGTIPKTEPISMYRLREYDKVWVEPISLDAKLRGKLRGWYFVKSEWVENSAGNRFLFDTYCAKWIAFEEI